MRRFVAVLATLVLVPLGAGPAQAADTVKEVQGFAYPAELSNVTRACVSTTPYDGNTTQRLYRADGAIGDHSIGFGFNGGTTGEAGIRVTVPNPNALTELSIETLHEQDPAGSLPGHYVVTYDPSGSGFATYYYASLRLNVTLTGWGLYDDLAAWPLDWYYFDGTTFSSTAVVLDTPLATFATNSGNGSGARLNFLSGCDGRDYYLDNLRVGLAGATTVYDFEGIPSFTDIGYWDYRKKKVKYDRSVTLVYGQGTWITGDGYGYDDDAANSAVEEGWFDGKARLFAKRYGDTEFNQVDNDGYTVKQHAWFKIKPKRNTAFWVWSNGTSTWESSFSTNLMIRVKRRVDAQIADRTVYRGQSIRLAGHVEPTKPGIQIRIERKVGSGWRAIAQGKTKKGGKFSFAPRATTAGKWKIRVVAAQGKGLDRNVSLPRTVTVRVPPPKPVPQPKPEPIPVGDPDPLPPPVDEPTGEPKPSRNGTRDPNLRNRGTGTPATVPSAPAGGASSGAVGQEPPSSAG